MAGSPIFQTLNTQAIIGLAHRDPNLVARFEALHQSRSGEWESHRHARHAQCLEGTMGERDFFVVDLNDLPIRLMKAAVAVDGDSSSELATMPLRLASESSRNWPEVTTFWPSSKPFNIAVLPSLSCPSCTSPGR
jgi:hypothetical protein